MNQKNDGETERLRNEDGEPLQNGQMLKVVNQNGQQNGQKFVHTCGETAKEQCASVFDLTFDPTSSPPQRGKQNNVWPQGMERILASLSAAAFHIPVGIVVGYSAILLPELEKANSEIVMDDATKGLVAAIPVAVVPFGALLTGFLVDQLGRITTIKLAAFPYTLGWILIATAQSLPQLLIGRFFTGFSLAMGPSPAIVYITEVARPDLRGSLICTGPSMTSLGMLLVYIKGAFLPWRVVAWLSVMYAVVPLALMFIWSPESPVWMLSKGKTDKALDSLKYLSRYETSRGTAERQLAAMQKELETAKSKTKEQSSCFKRLLVGISKPTGFKPFLILVMMFFFQQFAGLYITIFYAVDIFKEMGSSIDKYLSSICIASIRLLVGMLTSGLLKRFGRRPLCIISGLGMAVSLAAAGIYTQLIQSGNLEPSWIPVACMWIYMTLSVFGLLSIPWTMTAELFPIEIRGVAQGLTVSLAHIIMFLALLIYPVFTKSSGIAAVLYLFAANSFASVIFVIIFLPETHKKMLSDIQAYFEENTIFLLQKGRSNERETKSDQV